MTPEQLDTARTALEMMRDNREYIEANERPEYLKAYDSAIDNLDKLIAEAEAQQAVQPVPHWVPNDRKQLTPDQIKRFKPVCADLASFQAGIRFMEREIGITGSKT